MTFTPGTRLGPYEIRTGRDLPGLGEVYAARDHDEQRDVAFRVLRADFTAAPGRLRRFEQEARAAALLAHPNILTVHDVGTDAQAAYIISEPIEGRTLREVLGGGALPVGTAIPYAVQIAHGLVAAHEKGVIHRDLTPEHILVTPAGGVKVVGFGLAAATQDESALAGGGPLGTPSYMSPEQVRGGTVDKRSDMFAFGAIVYEMLTGTRAFRGDTPADTLNAVLTSDPPQLLVADLPPVVTRIVELSLKKHPGSRLSADDAVAGLQSFWSQPVVVDVAADTTAAAPAAPVNTGRFLRIAAVVGAVAVVAGLWLFRSPASSPPPSSAAPAPSAPVAAPPPPPSTPAPTAATPPPPVPSAPAAVAPPPPSPPPQTPAARPAAPTPSMPAPATAPPATAPTPRPPAASLSTFPRPATGPQVSQLVWFGRDGKELGRVGQPGDYGDVSLSPDGMRVAVSVRERGSDAADIWVFDVASGMGTRLTSDPADDIAPVWSPDGGRIFFTSMRKGSHDIYQRASSAAGNDTIVVEAPGDQLVSDWSSDGRHLLYQSDQRGSAGGNLDLWARQLPSGRPFAFLRSVHAVSRAMLSPDGNSVAYTSVEAGRADVYVAPFPRYDGRRRISAGGGSWSRWRRDGSELFYLDLQNRLMAAPMARTEAGADAGAARPLFQARAKPGRGYAYDVSADGQRIVVNTVRE